jgi:hypothetical protein
MCVFCKAYLYMMNVLKSDGSLPCLLPLFLSQISKCLCFWCIKKRIFNNLLVIAFHDHPSDLPMKSFSHIYNNYYFFTYLRSPSPSTVHHYSTMVIFVQCVSRVSGHSTKQSNPIPNQAMWTFLKKSMCI